MRGTHYDVLNKVTWGYVRETKREVATAMPYRLPVTMKMKGWRGCED